MQNAYLKGLYKITEYRPDLADKSFCTYFMINKYGETVKCIDVPAIDIDFLEKQIGYNWHKMRLCLRLASQGLPMPWEPPKKKELKIKIDISDTIDAIKRLGFKAIFSTEYRVLEHLKADDEN